MKRKQAIAQLAERLALRDAEAVQLATENAGNAATVTPVTKDYAALAKEHLDRAINDLAYDRALQNIRAAGCVTAAPAALGKYASVPLEGGKCFNYKPGPVPCIPGSSVAVYLRQGWTVEELRSHGYIL